MNIQELRVSLGISQSQLAMQAKVSRATIIRMEAGKPIYPSRAVRICKILQISPEDSGITLFNAVEHAARRKRKQ